MHSYIFKRAGADDERRGFSSIVCPLKRKVTRLRSCRISSLVNRSVVIAGRAPAGSALVAMSVRVLEWINPASAGWQVRAVC